MTTQSPVSAQTHQYFLQEAAELMQTMDEDLQDLRQDFSVQKVHNLMRAAHTLKGAAASVGLDSIKATTHSLEDVFKALCHQDAVISVEMEGLIFGAYECLQMLISAQHSNTPRDESYIVDRMANTVAQLQAMLGDRFGQEGHLPSSSELGFDMTQSIFEMGVAQRLAELSEAMADGNASAVQELLDTQAEVFIGLAESLELPGFGKIAQTVLNALESRPQQSLEIATAALEDYTAAKDSVLAGDRTQGGTPSAALLSFTQPNSNNETKGNTEKDNTEFESKSSLEFNLEIETDNEPSDDSSYQASFDNIIDTDWLLAPSDSDTFLSDPAAESKEPTEQLFIEPPLDFPNSVPHSFSSTPIELADARWPENLWHILTRPIGGEKPAPLSSIAPSQFIQYTVDYPPNYFTDDACDPIPYSADDCDLPEDEHIDQTVFDDDEDAFYAEPTTAEVSPLDLEQLSAQKIATQELEPIDLPSLVHPELEHIDFAQITFETDLDQTVLESVDVEQLDLPLSEPEPLDINSADPDQFYLQLSEIEQLDLEPADAAPAPSLEDSGSQPALPHLTAGNISDGNTSDYNTLPDLSNLLTAATEDSLDSLELPADTVESDITDFVAAIPVEPPIKAVSPSVAVPSRPQATIRMDVQHVEKLSQAMGELLTQQNRQALYSDQLVKLVKLLLEQTNQQSETAFPQQKTAEEIELYVQQSQQTINQQKRLLANTRETLLEARMLPMDKVFQRFPTALQRLKTQHNKPANLVLEGCDVLVDKAIADKLFDPLLHLVRNAFDHGIEPTDSRQQQNKSPVGTITLSAKQQGRYLTVQVTDDGRGIDLNAVQQKAIANQLITPAEAKRLSPEQTVDLLFEPGFSTASAVDDLSGRGVGLDAVKDQVRSLQGHITITHTPGAGSCFTLYLPASLTIAKLLICQTQPQPSSQPQTYALIADAVEHILIPTPDQLRTWEGGKTLTWQTEEQEHLIPVHSLSSVLRYSQTSENNTSASLIKSAISAPIILLRYKDKLAGDSLLGIEVEQLIGEQELVINALGTAVTPPSYIYGTSILPTGELTLVLDGSVLSRTIMTQRNTGNIEIDITENTADIMPGAINPDATKIDELKTTDFTPFITDASPLILTIDDSLTVRSALADILQKNGYQVIQARDGSEALRQLQTHPTVHAIICDLEMPGMNGFEFLKIRQKRESISHIPTIMLSSRGTAHHRLLTQTLGATAHLTKPFSPTHLLTAITEAIPSKSLLSVGGSSHE